MMLMMYSVLIDMRREGGVLEGDEVLLEEIGGRDLVCGGDGRHVTTSQIGIWIS